MIVAELPAKRVIPNADEYLIYKVRLYREKDTIEAVIRDAMDYHVATVKTSVNENILEKIRETAKEVMDLAEYLKRLGEEHGEPLIRRISYPYYASMEIRDEENRITTEITYDIKENKASTIKIKIEKRMDLDTVKHLLMVIRSILAITN